MSDLLLFGDVTHLSLYLERTLALAVWYSVLFWLPVRVIAAMIDRRRGVDVGVGVCHEAMADPAYRIGMDIVPPM